MNKPQKLTALVGFVLLASTAQAQVNININPTPAPPVVAAPAGTQYYYIPELNGYYDLNAQRYVVLQNGDWTRVTTLSGYNPTTFHPQVIDYRGATPWVYIDKHKGHPHGMPPGQAKKLARQGVVVAPGGGPVYYADKPGKGNGKGHGKGHGKH